MGSKKKLAKTLFVLTGGEYVDPEVYFSLKAARAAANFLDGDRIGTYTLVEEYEPTKREKPDPDETL